MKSYCRVIELVSDLVCEATGLLLKIELVDNTAEARRAVEVI